MLLAVMLIVHFQELRDLEKRVEDSGDSGEALEIAKNVVFEVSGRTCLKHTCLEKLEVLGETYFYFSYFHVILTPIPFQSQKRKHILCLILSLA